MSNRFCYIDSVPALQQLLFPDPRPLVDRLGRDFFRQLPACAGVYLMRDAADTILYIGKAKNLRKRLASYRVANPDRTPRRHLRLLRAVVRIEVQVCPDESSALARESELLRAVRPKFNRAGTWPARPRYLAWRRLDQRVQLTIFEHVEEGWCSRGPVGGWAWGARSVLARLIWLGVHPRRGFTALPAGWFGGTREQIISIDCGAMIDLVEARLDDLVMGKAQTFPEWIRGRLPSELHPFEKAALEADLEWLAETSWNPAARLTS